MLKTLSGTVSEQDLKLTYSQRGPDPANEDLLDLKPIDELVDSIPPQPKDDDRATKHGMVTKPKPGQATPNTGITLLVFLPPCFVFSDSTI